MCDLLTRYIVEKRDYTRRTVDGDYVRIDEALVIPAVDPNIPEADLRDAERIVYFVRNIALYLQNHPGLIHIQGWNVNVNAKTHELILITQPFQSYHIDEPIQVIYGIARTMRWLHAHDIIHGDLARESISIDRNHRPRLGLLSWSSCRSGSDESLPFANDFSAFSVLCSRLRDDFSEWLEQIDYSDPSEAFSAIVDFLEDGFYDDVISLKEYFDEKESPLDDQLSEKISAARLQALAASISGQPFIQQCARVLTYFTADEDSDDIMREFIDILETQSQFEPYSDFISPDSREPSSIFRDAVSVLPLLQTVINATNTRELTPIGDGVCGTVHRTVFDGRQVAVKQVPLRWRVWDRSQHASPFETHDLLVGVLRETLCLMFCSHPAVIPIVGWSLAPGDPTGEFTLVTELMVDHVKPGELDATQRMIIAYGVARGMAI
jgi:hypothetical protein